MGSAGRVHKTSFFPNPMGYYETNREKVKAAVRDYKQRERKEAKAARLFPRKTWWSAAERAKKRGWEFTIKREDFPIPAVCPALGILLDYSDRDHTPTLDWVQPSGGYTVENTVVVSGRANRTKSDLTIGELQQMADFYNGR